MRTAAFAGRFQMDSFGLGYTSCLYRWVSYPAAWGARVTQGAAESDKPAGDYRENFEGK